MSSETHDPVNHPAHYKNHPSGLECIWITRKMGFLGGNAVKYLWRAGQKGDRTEDLRKAQWYINEAYNNRDQEQICGDPARAEAFIQWISGTPNARTEDYIIVSLIEGRFTSAKKAIDRYLGDY